MGIGTRLVERVCRTQQISVVRYLRSFVGDLSNVEIDRLLRHNERQTRFNEGAVLSYESNQLGANKPCEDHFAEANCLKTNSHLFGIFDGHAGSSCSKFVSQRLFDYMAISLLPESLLRSESEPNPMLEYVKWLYCSGGDNLDDPLVHQRNLIRFLNWCLVKRDALVNVKGAFQSSFWALDQDLSIDAKEEVELNLGTKIAAAAISGSCACVAHVRGPNLHVANVGDSIAVLGVRNEQGWSARQITKDHSVENADEVKRIRSEHPAKESATVLRGGRLLGQLYPLRAFGDIRFKWTQEEQSAFFQHLNIPYTPPVGLDTPPYLTARPEVYYHRLTPSDKFLVIASDGLWECLSPDRVVRLISDHYVGRKTLSAYNRTEGVTVDEIFDDLTSRKLGEGKKPQDENSATHLIREAIGGSGRGYRQYKVLNAMLSLPQGAARNYRDDITVTIIYFDTEFVKNCVT